MQIGAGNDCLSLDVILNKAKNPLFSHHQLEGLLVTGNWFLTYGLRTTLGFVSMISQSQGRIAHLPHHQRQGLHKSRYLYLG